MNVGTQLNYVARQPRLSNRLADATRRYGAVRHELPGAYVPDCPILARVRRNLGGPRGAVGRDVRVGGTVVRLVRSVISVLLALCLLAAAGCSGGRTKPERAAPTSTVSVEVGAAATTIAAEGAALRLPAGAVPPGTRVTLAPQDTDPAP